MPTNIGYRTELFMPIMKEAEGKYIAVLSDDSVDRDDECMSKKCIQKLEHDGEYLAALCNHNNDIFMMVAEWTNRGVREIDGHTALISEPKFYKSNPNSQIIQGMLDEGAKPGVSIGAIVRDYEDINGTRVYTDLEIVEASFVAIPSNRHGRAMAVAKSFKRKTEDKNMEKQYTQDELDSVLKKKSLEFESKMTKELEAKNSEISKLKDTLAKIEGEKEEAVSAVDKAKKEADEVSKKAEEKFAELEAKIDKVNKEALEKQKYAAPEGDEDTSGEDVEKAFFEGKIPIMRG